MVRKLSHFLGEFRREAILAPSLIVLEAFCELLIPLVMARIIDIGINGDGGLRYVLIAGLIMLVLSILSMLGGVGAARYASIASQGFGRNLRSAFSARSSGSPLPTSTGFPRRLLLPGLPTM